MTQDQIFVSGEADNWFARNKKVLVDSTDRLAHDPVLKLMNLSGMQPEDVLEVGASNGYRLQAIYQRYGSHVTAVEPSFNAIEDGRTRYPAVHFVQGTAAKLPIDKDALFDLVIVNFVFHWIDRLELMRSVAEIDRTLKDGGHLIIGDFYPPQPERVKYHHLPDADVWTYKQDYGAIFLASNLYEWIIGLAFEHNSQDVRAAVDSDNRGQAVLLRKTLTGRYNLRQFTP